MLQWRAVSLLVVLTAAGGMLAQPQPGDHVVEIRNFSFTPAFITIPQGATVAWVWVDSFHSTTSTNPTEPWDSGVRTAPNTFRRTFANTGTFDYFCSPHSGFMFGSVTVESAAKADTTTDLSSSLNPSAAGASVTFTAMVTAIGGGTPTGSVVFTADMVTDLCGPVNLVNGSAGCTTASLPAGTHTIAAVYSGDSAFNASTSSELSQVVNAPLETPSFLTATATSTSEVALAWGSVPNAMSYEILRSTMGSPFSLLATVSGTSANDSGLSPDTTYLYRVRAIGSGGMSAPTATDPATTVVFTDPSLEGVVIKAEHVNQLRTAVNAMRAAVSLLPGTYTDDPLTAGAVVKAAHILELREALTHARHMMMLSGPATTDTVLTVIKAVHQTELRTGTQ